MYAFINEFLFVCLFVLTMCNIKSLNFAGWSLKASQLSTANEELKGWS